MKPNQVPTCGETPGNSARVESLEFLVASLDSARIVSVTYKLGSSAASSMEEVFGAWSWKTVMHQRLFTPSVTKGIPCALFQIIHVFPSEAGPNGFTIPLQLSICSPVPQIVI